MGRKDGQEAPLQSGKFLTQEEVLSLQVVLALMSKHKLQSPGFWQW